MILSKIKERLEYQIGYEIKTDNGIFSTSG